MKIEIPDYEIMDFDDLELLDVFIFVDSPSAIHMRVAMCSSEYKKESYVVLKSIKEGDKGIVYFDGKGKVVRLPIKMTLGGWNKQGD